MEAIHRSMYLADMRIDPRFPPAGAHQISDYSLQQLWPCPLCTRNALPLRFRCVCRSNQSVGENVHHANFV